MLHSAHLLDSAGNMKSYLRIDLNSAPFSSTFVLNLKYNITDDLTPVSVALCV